jgi:hypothetical protein
MQIYKKIQVSKNEPKANFQSNCTNNWETKNGRLKKGGFLVLTEKNKIIIFNVIFYFHH